MKLRTFRVLSTVLIILAVSMVVLGLTALRNFLAGWLFLIYWFACFILTVGAAAMSVFEMLTIRRIARQAYEELIRDHFQVIENAKREDAKSYPEE